MHPEECEIIPDTLLGELGKVILVDVRNAEEQKGPTGFIQGSILATMGNDLGTFLKSADPEASYVFICEHGRRSLQAVMDARTRGFSQVKSLQGGMTGWRNSGK